jgi:diacylglycerol kinase family enzyme
VRPRAAVVVNPTKVQDLDECREWIETEMEAAGWEPPLWSLTRAEDPGRSMAAEAAAARVDVVFAYGGDGTVAACAAGLAGTGVPLAVLGAGTGNLLSRNLGIPAAPVDALKVGMSGRDRVIDLGDAGGYPFVVMAGVGLDAGMVAGTPERLKARAGWPAYLVGIARHLADRPVHGTLTLDDGPPRHVLARMVIVGNVGETRGGICLLPDAEPDDGQLDVLVLAPGGLFGWLWVFARTVARRHRQDRRTRRYRARTVRLETDRRQERECDGDPAGAGTVWEVSVRPAALLVRVP